MTILRNTILILGCLALSTTTRAQTTCEKDEDCDQYWVCVEKTTENCQEDLDYSCKDGESDQECADRADALKEANCTEETAFVCDPAWYQSCEEDADCIEDFVCSDTANCQWHNETCESSEDCPEGWECLSADGGYCESGDNCVNNQLKIEICAPPQLEGDGDEAQKEAESTTSDENTDDANSGEMAADDGEDSEEGANADNADDSGCAFAPPKSSPVSGLVLALFGMLFG